MLLRPLIPGSLLAFLLATGVVRAASGPDALPSPGPLAGTDVTRLSVLGVRLYMPAEAARAALERTGLFASPWLERLAPCADQAAGEPPACVATALLTGPVGVTLRFVEDLPAHPRSSVVAELQVSEEPRTGTAQAAYRRRLLALYGPPDLRDAVGMQWGVLTGPAAERTVRRTLPLLESSNDEMLRLSDTGFEEREAVLATRLRGLPEGEPHPAATAAGTPAGPVSGPLSGAAATGRGVGTGAS